MISSQANNLESEALRSPHKAYHAPKSLCYTEAKFVQPISIPRL